MSWDNLIIGWEFEWSNREKKLVVGILNKSLGGRWAGVIRGTQRESWQKRNHMDISQGPGSQWLHVPISMYVSLWWSTPCPTPSMWGLSNEGDPSSLQLRIFKEHSQLDRGWKPRPSLRVQCPFHYFRARDSISVQILAESHAKMVHIKYILMTMNKAVIVMWVGGNSQRGKPNPLSI